MENYLFNDTIDKLHAYKVIPVIKINNSNKAEKLAEILIKNDLLIAEITFRTPDAAQSIEVFSEKFPEIYTGAGTVLTIEQVDRAIDAGAEFIVSPGFNPRTVDYCISKHIPVFPGINNPTGIELALEKKISMVKFFPAEASGGIDMLKALSAPFGDILFIPTGGININNLSIYLSSPKVVACGGSWMVDSDLISNGDFDEIDRLCRDLFRKIETMPYNFIT